MENNKQTQAVAQQQPKPVDLLKSVIRAESVQQQFQNALGKHKDEFVASLIDLYTGDPQLQRCKPQAVVAEALRAATMRLALNKALGFAYIIVFNNSVKDPATGQWTKVPTPTFVPGYKGYIQLAMRTGQVAVRKPVEPTCDNCAHMDIKLTSGGNHRYCGISVPGFQQR